MGEEGRLANWLKERSVQTGDVLHYAYHGDPSDRRTGLVIDSGHGLYDILPVGSCYYEDMRKHLPLKVTRPDYSKGEELRAWHEEISTRKVRRVK